MGLYMSFSFLNWPVNIKIKRHNQVKACRNSRTNVLECFLALKGALSPNDCRYIQSDRSLTFRQHSCSQVVSLGTCLCVPLPPGSADSVVVLSQPHELVTMTTEDHAYGEDVVALL